MLTEDEVNLVGEMLCTIAQGSIKAISFREFRGKSDEEARAILILWKAEQVRKLTKQKQNIDETLAALSPTVIIDEPVNP